MADEKLLSESAHSGNIDILFEELQLAVQWDRPSILFSIDQSAWGQRKSTAGLQKRLNAIGCTVVEVRANPEKTNIVHQILETAQTEKTVIFVFSLNSGSPDDSEAYRALNMHREFFVENRIKAVFWLSPQEAETLPRFAPDFWAFRHRVVEFKRSRTTSIQKHLYLLSLWYSDNSFGLDPVQEVFACKESLKALPLAPESRSIRAQIMYDLGYAYWRNGAFEDAESVLTSGFALVESGQLADLDLRFLNGIAVMHFQNSRYDKALEIYGKLLDMYAKETIPIMNRALVLCSMGKNYEALIQGKRAARYEPVTPRLWNRLGYINVVAGKLDDALACYKEAVRLAPAISDFHESLMVCFRLMQWGRQSIAEFELIRKLGQLNENYIEAYRRILMDEPQQDSDVPPSIAGSQKNSPLDITHEINLKLIMGD